MAAIFICYRREDSPGEAGRLRENLSDAFGEESVFLDTESVSAGTTWPDRIREALANARAVVVVIGSEWLAARDADQRRKIDLEDDWVRTEIESSLRMGKEIFPILVGGAAPLRSGQLPEPLEALAARQHFEVNHSSWSRDVSSLITQISEVTSVPERTAETGPTSRLPVEVGDRATVPALSPPATLLGDQLRSEYASNLREPSRFVSMIGVTGGDCSFDIDEVYVPIRLSALELDEGMAGDAYGDSEPPVDEGVVIQDVLASATAKAPHALVIGDPGSGKTTSLKKLQRQCLTSPDRVRGLAGGAVPVFVRLRYFREKHLRGDLAGFVADALPESSGVDAPEGVAEAVCDGPALLLLDGLDEVADPTLRAGLCGCLNRWITEGPVGLQAVMTSRPAGLYSVDPGARFRRFDMAPLNDTEVRKFVAGWFREGSRQLPHAGKDTVARRDALLAALEMPEFSTQTWKVLTGNPLVLTLLCLLYLRGQMTFESPGEFHRRCLEVLLERHSEDVAAPLGLAEALPILRRLGFTMHRDRVTDESKVLVVERLSDALRRVGAPCRLFVLHDWLYRHAGIIRSFGSNLGFLHSKLQEYLAAAYLCDDANEEISSVAEGLTDPNDRWWHDPLVLLAAMAGRQSATELLRCLCRSPALEVVPFLVEQCLTSMNDVDLVPLENVAHDSTASDSRRREARRLLSVRLRRPTAAFGRGVGENAVFMYHDPDQANVARDLAKGLRDHGLEVWTPREKVPRGSRWQSHLEGILTCEAAVVLVAPGVEPPWSDPDLASCLRIFAAHGAPVLFVALAHVDRACTVPPKELGGLWVDSSISAIWEGLRNRQTGRFLRSDTLEDGRLGLRLLSIPGGNFRMGAKDIGDAEKPVHDVRVSPFWLGETPVTNRQYERFLIATGRPEPGRWRNVRFSDPEQPIEAVGWLDAKAYCQWASEETGRQYSLPTEAQWEFAARGEESRLYPWGDDDPTPDRVCFGLDLVKGRPPRVGSFPLGAGPYKNLDQAGLVWEWCGDVWDPDAYSGRGRPVVDPVVEAGDNSWRSLRGGCWFHPKVTLRPAYRRGHSITDRLGGIGFRVAVTSREP